MFSGEQQLGRYRLLKLIATGGMGEIYLAEDASINRQVAIKTIRSESTLNAGASGPSEVARLFEREAKAIAMLDHPHILPLYDYGEEKKDGTLLTYLVMPYRSEGSLANWLEQRGPANPPALDDVEHIITQAASALQYTHDHQLIHQDVKPSNFLIRANKDNPNRPDVLISDFGIARLSNITSSTSQNVRGTPSYMAPEQWEGHTQQASDQYALAVMTYELITGHPPFKGNPMQMMYAHVHTPPQPPSSLVPGLPPALDAVILRGLAKQPTDRFPNIADFAQAFQQAVRGTLSSPAQLARSYTSASAASLGDYSSNTPDSSDLYSTLAISEAEATNGSSRLVTLPDGSQMSVAIPAGAYNGQVLQLNNANAPTVGATPNIVHLKLSVRVPVQGNNHRQGTLPTNDAPTYASGPASNNPYSASTAPRRSPGPVPGPMAPAAQGQSASLYSASESSQYPGSAPQQPITGEPLAYTPASARYPGSSTPPPGGPTPPYAPSSPPRRPNRAPRGLLAAIIAVALLLVLGGSALAYMAHRGNATANSGSTSGVTTPDTANLYATQTAKANEGQNVQGTATAQANATISAQGTTGAQSPATPQAGATATPSADNPYGGTLKLNDPMADNSQGYGWNVISDASVGTSCGFTNGAYHIVMPGNYGGGCFGQNTSFSDFAFQTQMEFYKYGQHFSGGGLIFRSTNNGQYYVLQIFESGQYSFQSCNGSDCSHGIAGYPKASLIPSFHKGLQQINTIAVVARGNTFTFYANGQAFAGPITDDTYINGAIGFYAEGGSEGGAGATVDVAYSNVKVWQFS